MAAQWLNIEGKHRRELGFHASVADFTLKEADEADPELLLKRPELSLYCLDDARRRALFVELPANVNLAESAFVYLTQYEETRRLLAVPYEDFLRLAANLPTIDRFIMIYMTGRSGSTLLCHVFNRLDSVVTLSEPDTPASFVHLLGTRPEAEIAGLFEASLRFLFFRFVGGKKPVACALKLRNEAIQLTELFQVALPQARNLFLYRDAVGFVGSFYRIFKRIGLPDSMQVADWLGKFEALFHVDARNLLPYLGRQVEEVSTVEDLTLWWLCVMEQYLTAVGHGLPVTAVRYEDLNNHREEALAAIFDACDLRDAKSADVLGAFEKDAQVGTPLAQERGDEAHLRLTPEQRAEIKAIVARHPVIGTPSFIAPHTAKVGSPDA